MRWTRAEEATAVPTEALEVAGWSDLARRSDVEHETGLLRGEMAALRAEMTGEFAAVRAEMAGGFAAMNAQFAAVGAEFAAVRAEFRGEIQRAAASQTRWMVTAVVALGALFTTVSVLGH
jgi:hypothetical protein